MLYFAASPEGLDLSELTFGDPYEYCPPQSLEEYLAIQEMERRFAADPTNRDNEERLFNMKFRKADK